MTAACRTSASSTASADVKFLALDAAVELVLCDRGIDLVRTGWLKALGGALHEFRVRHDEGEIVRMFGAESSGVGGSGETVLLRVFVHFYGSKVVLLPPTCGGLRLAGC